MDKKIKYGIKNQFLAIVFMVLFNMITSLLVKIGTSNAIESEIGCSRGIFGGSVDVNLQYYIPSMIILLLIYFIFWSKFFKKYLLNSIKINKGFLVCYIIIFIFFIITNCFVIALSELNMIGFNTICNIPNYFEYIMLALLIMYTIISLLITRKKNDASIKK